MTTTAIPEEMDRMTKMVMADVITRSEVRQQFLTYRYLEDGEPRKLGMGF
ncbi:hypothetical protein J2W35_003287 [Variovorax boronicumulans]|nr:hypothetical protein [Variovorax boronicumulans]MDQ0082928.1 hypothetical protein [Variovorax boronicumulans]